MALTIRTDKKIEDVLNDLKSKLNIKTQSGVIKKVVIEYQNILKDNFNLNQTLRDKEIKIDILENLILSYVDLEREKESIAIKMLAISDQR